MQKFIVDMAELKTNSKLFNCEIKGVNMTANAKLFIEKERIFLDVFPTSPVIYKYTLDRLVFHIRASLLKSGSAIRKFQRKDWFPENNTSSSIVKKEKSHMVILIFDVIGETMGNDYDQLKIEYLLQPESYKALYEISQNEQVGKNEQSE